uniref:Mini-chromosome maintenance complex-binding protein n=1 Tax=Sinocyclocheilus rhinocerous TaxID=307959 RepID=A0A673JUZ1_9TELE
MPTVHDWINNPLAVVDGLFAQSNSSPDWEKKVVEYFKEKLKLNDAHTWVPSLNDVPLYYLKPNSLVKFRCMVQDMFDPEFFMGVYETNDLTSNSKQVKCGKYRDITVGGQVDFNSRNTVTSERQTFYCVPIPGESQWNSYAGTSQARVVPSTSYVPNRHKRSYEEDDEMDTQPQQMKDVSQACDGNVTPLTILWCPPKRQETEAPSHDSSSAHCTSSLDLNFPLPGEKGPACLVKVYEDWDSFKLNDMLEVFGILSADPALRVIADEREASLLLDPTEVTETVEEQRVHSPPASLVPRLHMLYAQPLVHNNPLLPSSAPENDGDRKTSSLLRIFRAELHTYLTHVLMGDSLAAEYLILHLISNVYSRRDVLPLGKFTLNLSGCPHSSPYTEHLYKAIQQLVPSSYRLCMSLHNMNNQRMVPRKDYTANRLVSGTLQLANNTSLFLDETQLEQGQLDATGVRNITALGNLISWQKVDYDFNYHQMEFPCNINVLITSEGRSLLPSDSQVHLRPTLNPPNLEEYLSAVQVAQIPSQLNKYRIYLSVARALNYTISDEITKAVEEDFVEMRKDDPQSMSAEDLHRLLVVARLLSLSHGQNTLSRDGWMKAKQLEALRISRTQQQKSVSGNEP